VLNNCCSYNFQQLLSKELLKPATSQRCAHIRMHMGLTSSKKPNVEYKHATTFNLEKLASPIQI